MIQHRYSMNEIAERGQEWYDCRLRAQVETKHKGEYLVIDVDTGEYEIDENHLAASDRAAAKHPGAVFYTIRIGYPTVGRIGARGIGIPR